MKREKNGGDRCIKRVRTTFQRFSSDHNRRSRLKIDLCADCTFSGDDDDNGGDERDRISMGQRFAERIRSIVLGVPCVAAHE